MFFALFYYCNKLQANIFMNKKILFLIFIMMSGFAHPANAAFRIHKFAETKLIMPDITSGILKEESKTAHFFSSIPFLIHSVFLPGRNRNTGIGETAKTLGIIACATI